MAEIHELTERPENLTYPAITPVLFDDLMTVFGYPDAYKVRSCMILFKYAASEQELFPKVLDNFFRGMEDDKTMEILGR